MICKSHKSTGVIHNKIQKRITVYKSKLVKCTIKKKNELIYFIVLENLYLDSIKCHEETVVIHK